MTALRRTPLYDQHRALNGKIVEFAGWELPVQYSGVIAEHHAVRQAAGLFDVSHMGEIVVSGPEAFKAVQYLTCNDLSAIYPGKAQYTAITNDAGGIVDDIIVYLYSPEHIFICVNASNAAKDFEWFRTHNKFDAVLTDKSAEYGQVALQGPNAMAILKSVMPESKALKLKPFHFADDELAGIPVTIARTGYTGEDGVEIFVPWTQAPRIWERLLEAGAGQGLVPCGLGARDSLRLEACYPLHGHELSEEITAIESGLGWIVKPDKGDFIGRPVLAEQKSAGAPRALVGFFVEDAGIARHGDKIFGADGREIGFVTSGTKTPTVNRALGLAIVESASKEPGTEIGIEVRGRRLKSRIAQTPFYKRPKSKS